MPGRNAPDKVPQDSTPISSFNHHTRDKRKADGDSEGVQCMEAGNVGAAVVGAWLHVGMSLELGI